MKAFFAQDESSRLDLGNSVQEKAHMRHLGRLALPTRVAVNRRTGVADRAVFAPGINPDEGIRESALA
jgi:hypothetical protein